LKTVNFLCFLNKQPSFSNFRTAARKLFRVERRKLSVQIRCDELGLDAAVDARLP
jgi:hypothetical protein